MNVLFAWIYSLSHFVDIMPILRLRLIIVDLDGNCKAAIVSITLMCVVVKEVIRQFSIVEGVASCIQLLVGLCVNLSLLNGQGADHVNQGP